MLPSNNSHFFCSYAVSFKEKVVPFLIEQRQKILTIVAIAFGLIAASYFAWCYFFKTYSKQVKQHQAELDVQADASDKLPDLEPIPDPVNPDISVDVPLAPSSSSDPLSSS